MHRLLALAAVALPAAGCYFEGTVAYHPTIDQSVQTSGTPVRIDTADGGGWSAGVNIGFYLDVQVPNRWVRGLGVGFTPGFNGYGIAPSEPVAKAAAKSLGLRGDLVLPTRFGGPILHQRLTFGYHWMGDPSATVPPETEEAFNEEAEGRLWFLGATVGVRINKALFSLSGGVERFRAEITQTDDRVVRVSSTGVGARLLIAPAFIGHAPRDPVSTGAPKPGKGCYYTDDPDTGKPVYRCM